VLFSLLAKLKGERRIKLPQALMGTMSFSRHARAVFAWCAVLAVPGTPLSPLPPQQSQSGSSPSEASGPVRAKKLVLKDGSFQLVREYQRNGDRERYRSEERED